jgi:hypothetical protein
MKVGLGWLETYEPLEELSFAIPQLKKYEYPEKVTHWMPLPKGPK